MFTHLFTAPGGFSVFTSLPASSHSHNESVRCFYSLHKPKSTKTSQLHSTSRRVCTHQDLQHFNLIFTPNSFLTEKFPFTVCLDEKENWSYIRLIRVAWAKTQNTFIQRNEEDKLKPIACPTLSRVRLL